VYGAIDEVPRTTAMVLLPIVVLAEDITWRAGATLVLARRVGPHAAIAIGAIAFAAVHLTSGPWVLAAAALVLGALWNAVLLRTRSLAAVTAMHLGWDALVMLAGRY
jgi:membrane protease YdiL (CAAX protease family)